uniref:NR LBD domain-containing protein n=1 Tax=Globodera pallida TaxID=36090 RepID=A0A183BTR1_GLOPA
MVGLIEAPYKGVVQYTEKLERSDREALLILISMTRKEMSTFFGRFLDINASEQHQMVLRRLATLDAFALIKEGISLAHVAVLHTIAPFLIGEDIFQLKASCLFVLLEDISSKNIACLMLVNGKKVKNDDDGIDLMAQIAKSAENHPKRNFMPLWANI